MDPGAFLTALWGDHPPGQVHIWINPSNTSLWYNNFDRVNQDLQKHAGRNVYTGVALAPSGPRRAKQRVLASHTTAIAGLWADIDYGTTGHKKPNLPPTIDDALESLDNLRFPPTIVVNSGHGIQPWWLFPQPWVFANAADRTHAQRLSRWWHTHILATLNHQGWTMDATHDLSRVLRLPGTTNHKEEPVPVTIISSEGPRIDRLEFLDLVPVDFEPDPHPTSQKATQTTAAPPLQQGNHAFTLDPSAEPPSIKLTTLLQFNKKFNRSWHGTRTDLQDQSPSSYDLSLATIALEHGWSVQQAVDLMIAWRRSHGHDLKLRYNYYQTTIDKALQPIQLKQAYDKLEEQLTQSQTDTPPPTDPTPPSGPTPNTDSNSGHKQTPPPSTGGNNPDLIETLNTILSINIIRITKFTGDPPVYWMSTTDGDITLGTVDNLISQTKFRNAVAAAATGRLIPTYKPDHWHKVGQTLLRACNEVPVGEASHPALETNAWLENYLTDVAPTDDRNGAAVTKRPFIIQDTVYIYADSFRHYVEHHFYTKLSNYELRRRLTMCDATPETIMVQIGPKRTSRYCWKLPAH